MFYATPSDRYTLHHRRRRGHSDHELVGYTAAVDGSPSSLGCDCCLHGHECRNVKSLRKADDGRDGGRLHQLVKTSECTVGRIMEAISQRPGDVQKTDAFGRTPLFYAIQRSCPVDVIESLFRAHRDAITEPDCCGDTPLHMLYSHERDPSMLQRVLDVEPSLSYFRTKSFSSQSLVQKVCAPWTADFRSNIRNAVASSPKLQDKWKKMVITLNAAYRTHLDEQDRRCGLTDASNTVTAGEGDDNGDTLELHMAIDFVSNHTLLSHFIEMYPEQAAVKMAGRQSSSPTTTCTSGPTATVAPEYPLHRFLRRPPTGNAVSNRSVLQKLIRAYPRACGVYASDGKLPVSIALASGYQWSTGVADIVAAAPMALYTVECGTGLHPFAHALVSSSSIGTAFSILRENPDILRRKEEQMDIL